MELPDSIRHLIEALRGGGRTTFDKSGKITSQQYGPDPAYESPAPGGMMQTGMRGYQLAVQEAKTMGERPPTYREWLESR